MDFSFGFWFFFPCFWAVLGLVWRCQRSLTIGRQTKTKSTTKTNTWDILKRIRTYERQAHRYSHLQSIKFRRRTREVFLPAHSVRFERFSSAERLTRTTKNHATKKKREAKSKKITSWVSKKKTKKKVAKSATAMKIAPTNAVLPGQKYSSAALEVN